MTDYHVLASAQLDAIASGDPDGLTVETLLSGQYSKRIVMISAILAAAADRCPGEHARLEEAWDLLAAAQQADPSAARALLTHPGVRHEALRVRVEVQDLRRCAVAAAW